MNILSKFPVNIDYILGIFLILTAAYQIYAYITLIIEYPDMYEYLLTSGYPEIYLLFCAVFLMALPHKNLRRTIWLCMLILAGNLLFQGYSEYRSYEMWKVIVYDLGLYEYSRLVAYLLTFSIIHTGCGIAMTITGVTFAARKVRSIYPALFAIILSIVVDYLSIKVLSQFNETAMDTIKDIIEEYLPHMILFGVFALVFTSDEVSWYTAKGGMYRALNRLRTANPTFGIYTISRDQLITLLQCDCEYTLRLCQGRYRCNLEVRHEDGVKTLVFCRNGVDSMVGAVYIRVSKIDYGPDLSKARSVDIYGDEGMHVRMDIVEPRKPLRIPGKSHTFTGMGLPKYKYKVTNESLYQIVEGTGSVDIGSRSKPGNICNLEITSSENGRTANILRADGTVFQSLPVNAIVPVNEFGAYTKLYIYGDMGQYLVFKIRRPKKKQ